MALIVALTLLAPCAFTHITLASNVQALFQGLASHAPQPLTTGPSVVMTQLDVIHVLVTPVWLAGPWLLIAWYAWRFPMRGANGDDAPSIISALFWHRRRRRCRNNQCMRCGYALEGLIAPRCPECGLAPSSTTGDE